MEKKLKAERAELWAKALELNDGKEARDNFRKGKRRCCLCVAADVAAEQNKDTTYKQGRDKMPKEKVSKWFGWETVNPYLRGCTSVLRNDKQGLSHKEIAALVRKEFCTPPKGKKSV